MLFDSLPVACTDEENCLFGRHFDPLERDGNLSPGFIDWFAPVIFSQRVMACRPELIEAWKRRWAKRSVR